MLCSTFTRMCKRFNAGKIVFLVLILLFLNAVSRAQTVAGAKSDAKELFVQLLKAIERDDKAGVIKILSAGFPADFTDNDGNTFLMQAAKGGKTNAPAALLAGEANPNSMINNNFGTGISLLIFAGADANRITKEGFPIWWLAMSDKQPAGFDINILKYLVKSGTNLRVTSKQGITPLSFAKSKKNPQLAEILIEAGAK